jgi:hypothetical protein
MTWVKLAVDDDVDGAAVSDDSPAVAVIVPVIAGAAPLDRVYAEYSQALASGGRAFEFVFMIEPWARGRVEALYPLMDRGEPIRILESGQTIGETAMLVAAVGETSAPVVVTLLPFFRVDPLAVSELVARVASGTVEVASARREHGNRTLANRVATGLYNALLRRSVRIDLRDLGSGVRAVRRDVFATLPLYGDSARYLPVLAHREGHRVEEITVSQHAAQERMRVNGPGIYLRRLFDLLGLTFLFRFSQKPLRFFGLAGSALLMPGLITLGVLFVQRMGGDALASRPILLLGALLVVLGIQAIGLGLIGEIIVHLTSLRRQEYRVRAVHSRGSGAADDGVAAAWPVASGDLDLFESARSEPAGRAASH